MIPFFFAAFAATTADLPSLETNWDAPQRFYVETEVQLPEFIWFNAEFNRNTRVMAYQIRSVLSCASTDKVSARKRQIRCDIDDISLVASGLPGDHGRVEHVLLEYDEVLSDADLMLVVRNDGRITDVNLHGPKARNLRTRSRNETLRLIMRHIAAGLEVTTSTQGDSTWISNNALMCTLPTAFGTAGPADTVHQGTLRGNRVEVISQGRGLMVPGEDGNRYTCEYNAQAMLEPGVGPVERRWSMRGEPTPSSPIAVGAAGYPYTQRGSFRRLEADERVDVGDTHEVVGARGQSAIQQGTR